MALYKLILSVSPYRRGSIVTEEQVPHIENLVAQKKAKRLTGVNGDLEQGWNRDDNGEGQGILDPEPVIRPGEEIEGTPPYTERGLEFFADLADRRFDGGAEDSI